MAKPTVLMIGPYPDGDMAKMEAEYEVLRLWEQPDKAAFLKDSGARVKAIATRGDLGAKRDLIDQLPHLEIIGCFGVGTDGIDLDAARGRGVRVANTPDVLTEDVADIALALMLAIARQIPAGEQLVRSGRWANENPPLVTRMHGKRLGIVGLGRIGRAIAQRAEGFGMHIAYHGRTLRTDSTYTFCANLNDLARESDFLVVAVTGGASTAGLISAEVLRALGPDGFFVNVARGSVVDEAALLNALEQRLIKGAALDVYLNEPNIDARFLTLDNVVLQPHHGSGTVETRKAMGQLVRDNLAAHFKGLPLLTPVA